MVALPPLVQALLDPKTYPEPPSRVGLVQTQMSFLFLAGNYVYKVKKPVDLGYLDYTTLAQRNFFCEREVELNRRLCPDTYLGVVPITRKQGKFALGGAGKAVEYAVKMRRLPAESMMDRLLASNQILPEMVTRLAGKLATFHQQAETSPAISAFGSLEAIAVNAKENFDQTEKYIGRTISRNTYDAIKKYTDEFVATNSALFQQRIAGRRIRDCHGDLHAAHICFTNRICIYDCIEFNDRFRYCDVASEIAFLAMDLDHYGRADLSRTLVKAYATASKDSGLKPLLNFYKCYRAYVRGKVEGFKLDDPYVGAEEKKQTLEKAVSYFDLARAYTRPKPALFITVGLVGTGKSTLAQALARRFGLTVVSSDVVRKGLAGVPLTEHHFEKFDSGIYSAESTRQTYDRMFAEAKEALRDGSPVILDASFIKRPERSKARDLAKQTGANFFVLECVLEENEIERRLAERLKTGSVSDGRPEILGPQRQHFDPVIEVPETSHIIVDASRPQEENVRLVLDRLYAD